MRNASGWLRQCESQKLANDTARLEDSMAETVTCDICKTEYPASEDICPRCEENAIGEGFDPTDDGDYAYDAMKDREALR